MVKAARLPPVMVSIPKRSQISFQKIFFSLGNILQDADFSLRLEDFLHNRSVKPTLCKQFGIIFPDEFFWPFIISA